MKNYTLLAILITSVFVLANCRQPVKSSAVDPGTTGKKKDGGKIEFREELHNFGTLKEGEIVSFSFMYRNKGEGSLALAKVEPSCDCLTVRYDREGTTGKEDKALEVVINTSGEWGNLIKTISVETSAGETKNLTVTAYVENINFNSVISN